MSGLNGGVNHAKFQLSIANGSGEIARKPSADISRYFSSFFAIPHGGGGSPLDRRWLTLAPLGYIYNAPHSTGWGLSVSVPYLGNYWIDFHN